MLNTRSSPGISTSVFVHLSNSSSIPQGSFKPYLQEIVLWGASHVLMLTRTWGTMAFGYICQVHCGPKGKGSSVFVEYLSLMNCFFLSELSSFSILELVIISFSYTEKSFYITLSPCNCEGMQPPRRKMPVFLAVEWKLVQFHCQHSYKNL